MAAELDATTLQPTATSDIRFDWKIRKRWREWIVTAQLDGEIAGECEAYGIPLDYTDCADFRRWIAVEWLGVEERFQRRGVGSALLREQLRRQAQRGVRFAILWTETGNVAARNLCRSLGFIDGPECRRYRLRLNGA